MNVVMIVFATLIATTASLQFGGYGSDFYKSTIGNVAKGFEDGVERITPKWPELPPLFNVQNFADFTTQTGKTYATAVERNLREAIFRSHKELVDRSNEAFRSGQLAYESAINGFADLSFEEFQKRLMGNIKSNIGDEKSKRLRQLANNATVAGIPDAFDWREKGGVTPPKFQGECGSCWAFSVTGAIEGHTFRKSRKLVNLSEQNLIDCGRPEIGLSGCDGGYQEYGFEMVLEQGGIAAADKYPYVDKKDTCSYDEHQKAAEISGFSVIRSNDEQTMKKVIATLGPLSCSIYGLQSLILYKRGIYNDNECNGKEVNHSVLIVGYGHENGQNYWIVKNSWGQNWGEDGFFRLPFGKNFCGIATECSFPNV